MYSTTLIRNLLFMKNGNVLFIHANPTHQFRYNPLNSVNVPSNSIFVATILQRFQTETKRLVSAAYFIYLLTLQWIICYSDTFNLSRQITHRYFSSFTSLSLSLVNTHTHVLSLSLPPSLSFSLSLSLPLSLSLFLSFFRTHTNTLTTYRIYDFFDQMKARENWQTKIDEKNKINGTSRIN